MNLIFTTLFVGLVQAGFSHHQRTSYYPHHSPNYEYPFPLEDEVPDFGDDNNVDCVVSEWIEWSQCSASCTPGGVQNRRRFVTVEQEGLGAQCPHLKEDRKCNANV
ncbi:unnamed protein product, partial [Soboliphyme baturini]|uniref:TSP1_spondin domain-containing protein n=1 Tax=Soboliphyme baturini TaxID=241478 RepID=A0A183INA0_9BILA